ncbi:hypothetical protein [Streptacidiphilus cavernicola]|uniref:Uncharacterized protein n=1 Tax=Streptacidiphilus cavernicola TaxID=3342716 RepID=A0ABV6VPF1_9ACTN
MSTPEESAVPADQDQTAVESVVTDADDTAADASADDTQPDGTSDSGGSPIRPDHVRTQP